MVIGCPGSGKSTFSRALQQLTGIPLFHLDMMNWNADRTTVDRAVFLARLQQVIRLDCWIIDGNYSSTLDVRAQACDTIIFLDLPAQVCLSGIRERIGQARPDMPWVEHEEDPAFLAFVESFHTQSRPGILALLERYSDREIHIFKSRREADDFLMQLQQP